MALPLQLFRRVVLRATDEDYPPCVHIPHSFLAIASYRQWRAREGEPRQWLFDLVVSFWSHSFGGGAAGESLVQGRTFLNFLTKKDFALYHTLVYLATYWSPYDIVYRTMSTPRHPARLLCVGVEALDGFTTLCGSLDKCFKRYPDNWVLPVITGVVMYNASSVVRWLDQRSRGRRAQTFLSAPGSGVTRGAVLTLAYCLFGRALWGGRRRDAALVALCCLEVLVELAEDVLGVDAFEQLHKPGLAFLQLLQRRLRLGPAAVADGGKAAQA